MTHIADVINIVSRSLATTLLTTFLLALTLGTNAFAGTGDNYPWKNDTAFPSCPYPSAYDTWGYCKRYCTSWAAWALYDRNGYTPSRGMGNASNWGHWARTNLGSTRVNMTPAVGAVAWWGATNQDPYGHVAWVKSVNTNGTVTIEEYNYGYRGNYNVRTIATNSVTGYIHFKDIAAIGGKDFNRDSVDDLFAINRQDGGSNSTAIHSLSGSNPSQFVLNSGSVLHKTTANWEFAIGDKNRDGTPDLYAINRHDAGSNSTAVHVINGANRSQFLWNTGTVLHPTTQDWSFAVADYNKDGIQDIYAINRSDPGSNSTAYHVIDGANPGRFLLNTGTILHPTTQDWSFDVADYNRDGTPDLYAISKRDAGSGKTAVHVIDGANPGRFLLNVATGLQFTDENWDFSVKDYNRDGFPDLYAANKRDAGSNSTALHVLNGANLSQFLLSTGTILHQTDSNWSIR